ncbi:MAG: two-component system response regulator [Chitinophagaceae bacterium]|nr:two-component system response regulator [Chitinophagaceae bacterium]
MSTKLRCLLLDDEIPGLTYLRMLCEQIPHVEVVKAFNDPVKLLEEAKQLDFDLCILDIEMPGLNGLQVAQLLQGKPVIFTTAYKEHAAEAYDLEAIDYIRKPVQKERLEKALQKAADLLSATKPEKQFVQLNTNKGKTLLFFDKILLVTTAETDKRDKLVLLEERKELVLKNISFEQILSFLPSEKFCRVNKKDIIALKTVKFFVHDEITTNINTASGNELKITLSDSYRKDFIHKTIQ